MTGLQRSRVVRAGGLLGGQVLWVRCAACNHTQAPWPASCSLPVMGINPPCGLWCLNSAPVGCGARVNEAHGVSERFRAALEASTARRGGRRHGPDGGGDGDPPDVGAWGSVWKALIRVHTLMMLRVRPLPYSALLVPVRHSNLMRVSVYGMFACCVECDYSLGCQPSSWWHPRRVRDQDQMPAVLASACVQLPSLRRICNAYG